MEMMRCYTCTNCKCCRKKADEQVVTLNRLKVELSGTDGAQRSGSVGLNGGNRRLFSQWCEQRVPVSGASNKFQSVVQAILAEDLAGAADVGSAENLGTIEQSVGPADPSNSQGTLGVVVNGSSLQQR